MSRHAAALPSPTRRLGLALLAAAGILALIPGCLGEPTIEERWTRVDVLSPEPGITVAPGTAVPLDVKAEVWFRSLLTGAVVAEVRVASGITAASLGLGSDPTRTELMQAVNTVLANSTSTGFGVVPVTGWDHLIRSVDVPFTADVPAAPPGGAVFLVVYLADAEEVDLPGGGMTYDITPFDFEATQVLPVVMELLPN